MRDSRESKRISSRRSSGLRLKKPALTNTSALKPLRVNAVITDVTPGTTVIGIAFCKHDCNKPNPGSAIIGVPQSEISAIVLPSRSIATIS